MIMPLLKKWEYDGAVCGIWKVTESIEQLRSLLTDESVTTEFYNYKSSSRQLEFLAVRVLLGTLLGKEQRISHYASGKPYLASSENRISISHTKGYVAVAIHPYREVGIDIEYFSERVRKVVGRFLGADEMIMLDKVRQTYSGKIPDEKLLTLAYLVLWSAKETMFKMMNCSDVDFAGHLRIDSISVPSDDDLPLHGEIDSTEKLTGLANHIHIEYYMCDEFVCTYSTLEVNG